MNGGVSQKTISDPINIYLLRLRFAMHSYHKWNFLADLLNSNNHYQRYISSNLIANLVKIDTENKFEDIFEKYFSNLDSERTMVAGQSALNAGKIALAIPNLQHGITERLLNIEKSHRGKQVVLIIGYVPARQAAIKRSAMPLYIAVKCIKAFHSNFR